MLVLKKRHQQVLLQHHLHHQQNTVSGVVYHLFSFLDFDLVYCLLTQRSLSFCWSLSLSFSLASGTSPSVSTPQCKAQDEFIATDDSCYKYGEAVKVGFESCSPKANDWVGVYKEGSTNTNMVGYGHQFWVWACGTQTTKCTTYVNVITFDANHPDESGYDTFPLDAGKYIVYLVRDNASGPPYESYLQSSA